MVTANLPHDGRGGYLYIENISIPNYANVSIVTTFQQLDADLWNGAATATTFGVLFGAMLWTLIHVFLFTTPDKRGRLCFNCIVVGLLFELVRQLCAIWSFTSSATASAYFLLTYPPDNVSQTVYQKYVEANSYTNFSRGTQAAAVIDQTTAVLGFIPVQIAFFVLVRVMMSSNRRLIMHLVTITLAVVGFIAIVIRLIYLIWTCVNLFNAAPRVPPDWAQQAMWIIYTISIGAWCLLYGFLVIRSAVSRMRMGIGFRRGEARHMMYMTALQSMTIPIVFFALQWLGPVWLPEAEYCVIPSILILLPFGTLWACSFEPSDAHRGHVGHYQPGTMSRS